MFWAQIQLYQKKNISTIDSGFNYQIPSFEWTSFHMKIQTDALYAVSSHVVTLQ